MIALAGKNSGQLTFENVRQSILFVLAASMASRDRELIDSNCFHSSSTNFVCRTFSGGESELRADLIKSVSIMSDKFLCVEGWCPCVQWLISNQRI